MADDTGIPATLSHRVPARASMLSALAAFAALAALAMGMAPTALAQNVRPHQSIRPGIGSDDPRSAMDRHLSPWHSLGRIENGSASRICTGVLVGPRSVLTAAHCLMTTDGDALVPATTLRFRLGYHQGSASVDARVTAYTTGPGFDPRMRERGRVSADWAMLALDRAILAGDRVLPILRTPLPARTPLMLGGYQRDDPERIMADMNCRVLGLERRADGDAALLHDCAGTFGSSGGPLLAQISGGAWAVVGVASRVALDLALGHAVPASAVGR